MTTSVGILELKIARLEDHLKILEKQQTLSRSYPVHLTHLQEQAAQIRTQLAQLRRQRMELLTYPMMYKFGVQTDEIYQR